MTEYRKHQVMHKGIHYEVNLDENNQVRFVDVVVEREGCETFHRRLHAHSDKARAAIKALWRAMEKSGKP